MNRNLDSINKQITELGLRQDTVDGIKLDPTRLIVDDCFNERSSRDYREKAIDTLIALGIPWYSEWNICFEVVKRFVVLICPYCGEDMKYSNASGSSDIMSFYFSCDHEGCSGKATLTIPSKGALSFRKD